MTLKQLTDLQERNKRTPIIIGCDSEQCFCTGRCKDIVGYWENGVYTPVVSNPLSSIENYRLSENKYNKKLE